MSEPAASLHAALVRIDGDTLLVPSIVIVEIAGLDHFTPATAGPAGPDWHMGWLTTAAQRIPVISFEALDGRSPPEPGRRTRLVVFKPQGEGAPPGGYAVLAQGQPQVLTLLRDAITPVEASAEPVDGPALVRVLVHGQVATIPDLDYIEARLAGAG